MEDGFKFELKDVVIFDIFTSGDSYDWSGCPTCNYGKIYVTYLAINYYEKETRVIKNVSFSINDNLSLSQIIVFFANLDKEHNTLQDLINLIEECGMER